MKTINTKVFLWVFPALLCLGLGLASCKEDEEELGPMRMFMPGGEISAASGESTVTLSWKTPANTVAGSVTYTVEVAKDTLFQTPIILTAQTDTTTITFTDEQLGIKEKYFARVKTDATEGSGGESKWLVSSGFAIRGAQIFKPVQSSDIIDRAVLLKWNETAGLTRIVLTPQGGTAMEVALTPEDVAASQKLVDGLASSTMYVAEIFAGTKSKGTISFTTSKPLSGVIIDLRGIENRPSVLQDTLPQIPNGSTVILKRGVTYTIAASVSLSNSVTITSGSDLTEPNLASIYFTDNFNIAEGSSIRHIVFKDVNLQGSDATAKYVFNINKASTIDTIQFENVRASMFRGVVRLQNTPITLGNFLVNNSVIDSIGSYGVINADGAASAVQKISITNSTIYKAEKVIVSKNNSASILIENVTINESPVSAQYLIDYSSSLNVTGGIQIKNSILGVGKAGSQTIRGIRTGSATLVEVSGTYTTSDYVTEANPIANLTPYAAASTALWQDPKNGDFHFRDTAFPGRTSAGDPRWRQ